MRYVLHLLHGRTGRLANGIRLLARGRGLNRGLRGGGRDRVHFCKRARSLVYFVLLLLKLVNFLVSPKAFILTRIIVPYRGAPCAQCRPSTIAPRATGAKLLP